MRASGSTTAFGRLPWPPAASAGVSGAVQSPDTYKPFFEKRTEPAGVAPTEASFGPFRLLPTQFVLLEGDRPVPLGSRALEILIVLLERPGELVSKQELMARVWPNIFVEPANLTVHISALRRMLRDGRDGNRFIINIPGRGYRFVASVEVGTRELRASHHLAPRTETSVVGKRRERRRLQAPISRECPILADIVAKVGDCEAGARTFLSARRNPP